MGAIDDFSKIEGCNCTHYTLLGSALRVYEYLYKRLYYLFFSKNVHTHNRALVSVGAVGAQHPQIFSKTEFAPTDFKRNPS